MIWGYHYFWKHPYTWMNYRDRSQHVFNHVRRLEGGFNQPHWKIVRSQNENLPQSKGWRSKISHRIHVWWYTYISLIFMVDVGKCTIHAWYSWNHHLENNQTHKCELAPSAIFPSLTLIQVSTVECARSIQGCVMQGVTKVRREIRVLVVVDLSRGWTCGRGSSWFPGCKKYLKHLLRRYLDV